MKKNKNLIIVGVAVVIIGVAGYLYAGRDQSSDTLLSSSDPSSSIGVEGDLLASLHQLQTLKLDGSIFSGAAWISLVDFSKPLVPQDKGRTNPFAPVDSGSSFTLGTSTASR